MMDLLCQAHIHLSALQHNFQKVKDLAPQSKVIAMIKGDGYGHGLETVARAFKHADTLGVARLHEAIQLRAAGIKQPIVIMEAWCRADELFLLQQYDFDTVIHQACQVQQFLQYRQQKPGNRFLPHN